MAPDGSRAIRIDSFEGSKETFDRDSLAFAFSVILAPAERRSRLIVHLDPLLGQNVMSFGFKTLAKVDPAEATQVVAIVAIASHLESLAPGAELGLHTIECWDRCLIALAERSRATDSQILQYLKAKLYWSWRYDMTVVTAEWVDTLLLGCESQTVDRVSMIALDEYITRQQFPNGAVLYTALPKLLKEFLAGFAQGGVSAGVMGDILQRLSAPRYAGPRRSFEKALSFFSSDVPDHENAAKEAISAVEALARIACGDTKATLGDLIQRLKGQGKLNPALAKSLEALWGFTSDTPGVRHGATGEQELSPAETEYVLGVSRAAISLLLPLDESKET